MGAGDDALVEAPFVMSGVNYETVGWSHALRKDPKCSYKEQLLVPDFKTGLDTIVTLVVFFTSLMNPLTGGLLEKLMTQPGDGPDLAAMENEYFLAATGTARGSKGTILQSLLYYDKDPGYPETARMVVESALCLALEEDRSPPTLARRVRRRVPVTATTRRWAAFSHRDLPSERTCCNGWSIPDATTRSGWSRKPPESCVHNT